MTIRPLTAFTLAFAAGILAAVSADWLIGIGAIALIGMGVMLLVTRRPLWLLYALYTAAGVIGSLDYRVHTRLAADDISRMAPDLTTLTGVVESDPEILLRDPQSDPSALHFTLRAEEIKSGADQSDLPRTTRACSGRIEVRLALPAPKQDTYVSWSMPHYGDRLSLTGHLELPTGPRNPGGFDYRTYLAHQGIHATLFVRRPADWHIVNETGRGGSPFRKLAYAFRAAVFRHTRTGFSPEQGEVLNGILLGERTNLSPELRDDFERTGTTHILATAGLHVGLVMAMLVGLFRVLRLSRRPALLLTSLCLILYIPMTGERVAMTRAAIMALIYLGGILLEREPYLPNTLSLAALVLLVGSPQNLFDAGFQLSFGIVITVAVLGPWMQRLRDAVPMDRLRSERLRALLRFLLDLFLIACAAQIGALPLVAYYFHAISLIGVVANLLIVPVVLPIIGLGFVAIALGSVAPILATPIDRVLDVLLTYIVRMTHLLASPDWASVPIGDFASVWVVAAYGALWGGLWYLSYRRKAERKPPS